MLKKTQKDLQKHDFWVSSQVRNMDHPEWKEYKVMWSLTPQYNRQGDKQQHPTSSTKRPYGEIRLSLRVSAVSQNVRWVKNTGCTTSPEYSQWFTKVFAKVFNMMHQRCVRCLCQTCSNWLTNVARPDCLCQSVLTALMHQGQYRVTIVTSL